MPYLGKYSTPMTLLRDGDLSLQEKIDMLKSWREDKEALMRATEEGMQGDSRSDLLRQIENALITLQERHPDR